jgi:hypothetical protein
MTLATPIEVILSTHRITKGRASGLNGIRPPNTWRIKSEILTRQKQHLDLQSGFLRLAREETSNGKERKLPLTPEMREVLVQQFENR